MHLKLIKRRYGTALEGVDEISQRWYYVAENPSITVRLNYNDTRKEVHQYALFVDVLFYNLKPLPDSIQHAWKNGPANVRNTIVKIVTRWPQLALDNSGLIYQMLEPKTKRELIELIDRYPRYQHIIYDWFSFDRYRFASGFHRKLMRVTQLSIHTEKHHRLPSGRRAFVDFVIRNENKEVLLEYDEPYHEKQIVADVIRQSYIERQYDKKVMKFVRVKQGREDIFFEEQWPYLQKWLGEDFQPKTIKHNSVITDGKVYQLYIDELDEMDKRDYDQLKRTFEDMLASIKAGPIQMPVAATLED